MTTNHEARAHHKAWATLVREWAIDGMPKDKQRLAETAFMAALTARDAELRELAESGE